MTSPLRLLAFALLLAPSLLPAAENQRFILERPYPVAEIPEPDRSLPVTNVILMIGHPPPFRRMGSQQRTLIY